MFLRYNQTFFFVRESSHWFNFSAQLSAPTCFIGIIILWRWMLLALVSTYEECVRSKFNKPSFIKLKRIRDNPPNEY